MGLPRRMLFVVVSLIAVPAYGALITQTLGTQVYLGGETPTTGAFLAAGAGDPAPFDGVFIGSDPTGPDFLASWTFSIGVITDPIVGAVLQLGIYDHDSAATGSQVASFLLNGVVVLTSVIDTAFEADPGLASQVKVYSLTLPGSTFAELASGSATFTLQLQGPGLGILGETTNNGAALDFSKLSVTTQQLGASPEPASLILAGCGLVAMLLARRRRKPDNRRPEV